MPATGKQGIAQLVGATAETSGTIAWMRPVSIGSTLLTTVPRYLPKYLLGHTGTVACVGRRPLRFSVKLCL